MTTLNEFSPKVTELIAVAGIAFVFIISVVLNNSNAELVQFLILFALAISRLLPASNRILLQSSTMRANEYVFDHLKELIPFINKSRTINDTSITPLTFSKNITLKNITYRHEGQTTPLFSNLNLEIQKGESVGLIGPSGSGKTTLLNLILRLLHEQDGGIYIDDEKLTEENKQRWYAMLGFVPQNINLIDGTFTENIAFGIPAAQIDKERVRRAAEMAMLTAFIDSQQNKFETQIGEGGLKISGGQRQRIGIARALYHDAQVLVFDEATSALDAETESMITESLRALSQNNLTIIVVAHRMETLKYCDAIYKLDNGKLSPKMTYQELRKT
jgi:ABC-type bacteriocin/lantibiotic exporter with double-glycine peptidase domain